MHHLIMTWFKCTQVIRTREVQKLPVEDQLVFFLLQEQLCSSHILQIICVMILIRKCWHLKGIFFNTNVTRNKYWKVPDGTFLTNDHKTSIFPNLFQQPSHLDNHRLFLIYLKNLTPPPFCTNISRCVLMILWLMPILLK